MCLFKASQKFTQMKLDSTSGKAFYETLCAVQEGGWEDPDRMGSMDMPDNGGKQAVVGMPSAGETLC